MKLLLSDEDKYPMLWKLMGAYLTIGFIGFCLIFFCLDRIGARVYPEKTGFQVVISIISNTKYFGIFEKHFALELLKVLVILTCRKWLSYKKKGFDRFENPLAL